MPGPAIGVVAENEDRRVALVPAEAARLNASGARVLVESGAGQGALCPDSVYTEAGATIVTAGELLPDTDIVVSVGPPREEVMAELREGQTVIGLMGARQNPELVRRCAAAGVTLVSMDMVPRTLTRAQPMDALTSQATIAGYKAVLVAADAYGGFFPMLITAAGTARPAQVLVLGAGVAGLQAIGTARRLGAVVTGYDVRPQAQNDIRSVGGRVLDLLTADGGEGGYARALNDQEQRAQQQALGERIAGFDVVIATAQVPGREPPLLVTAEAVKGMRPGSVLVDLAAGPFGGNIAGSEPGRTVTAADAITVIGAGELPSAMPVAASAAYSRNISAVLDLIVRDGGLSIDLTDEIVGAMVAAHEGRNLLERAS